MQHLARSKNEIYNLLTLDLGVYLPKKHSTNAYFYKKILNGEKKVSSATAYSDSM